MKKNFEVKAEGYVYITVQAESEMEAKLKAGCILEGMYNFNEAPLINWDNMEICGEVSEVF